MKTSGRLKLILGLALLIATGFITLNGFSSETKEKTMDAQDSSVMITIDSNTTDKELDEIKTMLKEHGIEVTFSQIQRNEEDEITGIKIELKDTNGNSAVSQMSSTNPISNISFGRKNGALYITQGKKGFGNFAFFGDDMTMDFNFDHDSIFKLHLGKLDSLHLNNMFDFDNQMLFFNGKSLDIDEFMDQIQNSFKIDEDDNGNKRIIIKKGNGNNFFFDDEESNTKTHQKFRFVDNPDTERLIIIDGKESDFKTLDDLAKNNKLESVDVLQSKTAMSIYGEKAKDGAIIATTK